MLKLLLGCRSRRPSWSNAVAGWRLPAAQELIRTLHALLPRNALIAAIAADEDGYAVELSDGCPPDGRFEIGSITKTMTGTVLASLADDGIVALQDEVGRWLDAGLNADITLEQLATHTSGLLRLSPSHVPGAPDPYEFLTAEVAERELRNSPYQPRGADWDYSNFGFQVLSLALERADRTAFTSLLERRVFRPLGMTCSGVAGLGDGARIRGHAQGKPVEPWGHHLWGAGGVVVSAEDMSRYLSACLAPPDSAVGWAIQVAQQPRFEIDPLRSAGLGWPLGPPGYLGHDGGTAGFRSMVGVKLPARRAAAVLVNERDARGLPIAVRRTLDAA
jgi:D-alanyl-D-alanine-carboxypeptidase/D-alanyl-D-alanine-endopeptidase